MPTSPAATRIPTALRKKLVGVAFASPEFRIAIAEGAAEIRACAIPEATEATIEGCFERVLYALLRDIGLRIHFEKEITVNLRRHTAKGRLDSRIGAVVIEYKRPALLHTPSQITAAHNQLEEYLVSLSAGNASQIVGVITNGLVVYEIRASAGVITSRSPVALLDTVGLERTARLLAALDLTALTSDNLIRDFCGADADGALFRTARTLYQILLNNPQPKTLMLQSEWQELFRLSHEDLSQQRRIEERRDALAAIFDLSVMDVAAEYRALFALQTAFAIVLKLIAFRVVSDVFHVEITPEFKSLSRARSAALRMFCERLEDGEVFRELGILNLLEGDFFSWYCDSAQWADAIALDCQAIVETLARYEDVPSIFASERAHDLFRELYQAAMPRAVRSSLGEFYTPYWLAEHVLNAAITAPGWRAIDPCCGSGTFVVAAIMRLRREWSTAHPKDQNPCALLQEILDRVAAIDLNPVSVLMTRINLFIHISDLLQQCGVESLVIPVYLGDAASVPEHVSVDGVDCLQHRLRTLRTPIDAVLPSSLVANSAHFMRVMLEFERLIEASDARAAAKLLKDAIQPTDRSKGVLAEVERLVAHLIDLERNGWDGIWARILANFMITAALGQFDAVVGNPPWIDWRNLPAGYRERVKSMCVERGLFSGAGRTGGINLNICALLAYTSMINWLDEHGRLAFLMPRELINQASYEGWRRLGSRGWQFLTFYDWTRAGHPFDPVKEDFLTFVIAKAKRKQNAVPVVAMVKSNRDRSRPTDWKTLDEALSHLSQEHFTAGQVIPESTGYTVAANAAELKHFALIAGKCEYIGREGIEFYPQELLLFAFDSVGPSEGTVFVKNVQATKSKYKHPARRFLLETKYLFPLVKGPALARFAHDYDGLIVAFPYDQADPLKPLPRERLRFESPRLFRYYLAAREAFESQTKFSDKIRGADPGEFYGLARTGPYSFAQTYVAFRDNTKWVASVVADARMPWGERKRFVFQNHAVSICERARDRSFITTNEAHYIAAILNTPIVERFIYASSDERSFKIRPPVFVPLYDASDPIHVALAAASRTAHKAPNKAEPLRGEMERLYLQMCGERCA